MLSAAVLFRSFDRVFAILCHCPLSVGPFEELECQVSRTYYEEQYNEHAEMERFVFNQEEECKEESFIYSAGQ